MEDNLIFDTFEMHIGDASKMKLLTLRSYCDKLYNGFNKKCLLLNIINSFYNIVVYKI